MTSLRKHTNVSSAILLAVLLSILGYQAGANRAANPVQPARVAVVNLPAVLNGLEQRSEAEMSMRRMGEGVNADRARREAEINRLKTEHEQLRRQSIDNPETAAMADAVEEQLVFEQYRFEAWRQFTNSHVDLEHSLILEDLYRVIKRAAAEMARAEGFDLVLVDDAEGELTVVPDSRMPRAAQIEQQINSRLMLYVNPTIDITSDLIQRMNNAHRAGGSAR